MGPDCLEPAAAALAEPWLRKGGRIIAADDPEWPRGLEDLGEHAPVLLWLSGQAPPATPLCVSIVGSRDCTEYGRSVARHLAGSVARNDGWVISGGAVGIDEAAHGGALDAGGRTVLCAAGGAGHVYPPAHRSLFERVADHGSVVWEYPPGSPLHRKGFLHRNRLISAIAANVVVVEAAVRSGALNTGRTAADLGRLVLGVPGPVNSPASAGVHRSIAEGWAAILVDAPDLIELTGLRVGRV